MNRRQKIIISVTSIFLVLLILVGLTYAYFLTQIKGNTNERSISVLTADLKLEYGDGNGLITAVNVIPGVYVTGNDGKTFTVENKGNATVENYGIFLTEVVNTLADTSDLVYTLTCVSKNVQTNEVSGTCNGVSSETEFPTNNSLVVTNDIAVGIRHEYRLDVLFKETNDDQSDNMNKTISAKIDLYALAGTIDIEGTVTGYQNGDYIVVNSAEAKKSEIIDGKYKVVGLLPDNHTITLYGSDNSVKASTTFILNKAQSAGVSGNTITMTDETRSATIDLTFNAGNLTKEISSTLEDYIPVPFQQGTLAYAIYNNALTTANGTTFRTNPLTIPAEESTDYLTGNYTTETVATSSLCAEYYPWSVADTEEGASSGSMVSSYSEAVGKYVYDQCRYWTKYLESYDSTNDTLTFRIPEKANESTLSTTLDDLGTSYYYRGAVTDNYVNFAGMCWRIVRIEGDGSVKLILEDQDSTCASSNGNWNIPTTTGGSTRTGNFGYSKHNGKHIANYLNPVTNSSTSQVTAYKNFQIGTLTTNIASTYNNATINDYLKSGNWCYDDKAYTTETGGTEISYKSTYYTNGTRFYYDSHVRLYGKSTKEPTLRCNGTVMNKYGDNTTDMYVATLTADEIVYAGGKVSTNNQDYYLINDYQKNQALRFWSLSPYNFRNLSDGDGFKDCAMVVNSNGLVGGSGVNYSTIALRPAVSLKSGTTISGGVGTKANAYTIN